MAYYEGLPIYKAAMDLVVALDAAVRRFSRFHKYTVGSQLREAALALVLQVAKSHQRQDREAALELACLRAEEMEILLNVAKEVKSFQTFNGYMQLMEQAAGVTKQAEGWRRSLKKTVGQNQGLLGEAWLGGDWVRREPPRATRTPGQRLGLALCASSGAGQVDSKAGFATNGQLAVHAADLPVHAGPIRVFTMLRSSCSRWADPGVHDGPTHAVRRAKAPGGSLDSDERGAEGLPSAGTDRGCRSGGARGRRESSRQKIGLHHQAGGVVRLSIQFGEREMRSAKAIIVGSSLWIAVPALWAAAPNGQYTDLKNGTVRDNKTGLVWQQGGSGEAMTWDSAKTYCSQLNLGGFPSGWRLPEKLELESIVDSSVAPPGPTIDVTAFPSTQASAFWTATPYAGGSGIAWYVNFHYGDSYYYGTTGTYWVRCVR